MIFQTLLAFSCVASIFAAGLTSSGSGSAGSKDSIDLQLSLRGGEAPSASFLSTEALLSGGSSSLRDSSEATSSGRAAHIDLQPELEPSAQPRDAQGEAGMGRLTELRHDLNRYFEANPETLPGAITRRKNWYEANIRMIKQRVLRAVELREKYKEIVDTAVGNKLWDRNQIRAWYDNVPNEQPWRVQFEPMRTRYLQIQEQVALIETALIDYERSFRA